MARMSHERSGAEMLKAHSRLVDVGVDRAEVGHRIVEAFLSMGLGERADPEATINDILTNVAKHAHAGGVTLEEIVEAMENGGSGHDAGSLGRESSALFGSLRLTVHAMGKNFDDTIFVVGEHLAAELPSHRP